MGRVNTSQPSKLIPNATAPNFSPMRTIAATKSHPSDDADGVSSPH